MTATREALQTLTKDLEDRKNDSEGDCQLENLRFSLHRAQAHVAELENLTLPISSLPDDVLSIILQKDTAPEYRCEHRPVFLSHVSRRWRSVASNTTSLWHIIDINTFIKGPELLDIYLENSRSRLLDISVRFYKDEDDFMHERTFEVLMDKTSCHASRWFRLNIRLHLKLMMRVLKHASDSSAPNLKHVTIFYTSPELQDAFIFAPGPLQSLDLRGSLCFMPLSSQSLQHLTTLSLNALDQNPSLSLSTFRQVLRATPLLSSLELKGQVVTLAADDPTADEPVSAVQMPFLVHFSICHLHGTDADYLSDLCRTVSTYAIKTLSFRNISENMFRGFMQCVNTGMLQYPALQVLRMSAFVWTDRGFSSLFPTITHLSLGHGLLSWLELLIDLTTTAASTGSAIPWPHLDTLTVYPLAELGDSFDVQHAILLNVLSARLSVGKPIRTLCLRRNDLNVLSSHLLEQVKLEEIEDAVLANFHSY
jgi:hypothetical protein